MQIRSIIVIDQRPLVKLNLLEVDFLRLPLGHISYNLILCQLLFAVSLG